MTQAPSSPCPNCGAPLPAGASPELCPACLLSDVLAHPGPVPPGALPDEEASFPFEWAGYRLLGRLGSGGMGTVYEAEEPGTGRRVALKLLRAQIDSPEVRRRFLREGRLAASVNHPNSLYVFGAAEHGGAPLITMEVAAGGTLADRLRRHGPLPVPEAVDAILDVVSGLEAAHSRGVLHRDVKPSNCFVAPDGSVKVGDYGLSVSTLARDDSHATASGVVMGTPAFASPEQLRGDELDGRADIYSVGATLYTLLAGRPPFTGKNAVQVVAHVVHEKPRPLGELRPEVAPELERVVARCLAKDAGERFPDYPALRDALLPFSSREPEPAPLNVRAAGGWMDFLIALLPTYLPLMLLAGGFEFHMRLVLEPSLSSARYYLIVLGGACLYFGLTEGLFGAGLGKRLKGLRVVGPDGRPPGVPRATLRILLILLSGEVVRLPFLWSVIEATRPEELTGTEVWIFFVATHASPWIAVLWTLTARRENGFATLWDLASGTRVVVQPRSTRPARSGRRPRPGAEAGDATLLGPFRVVDELVPGEWIEAVDPVLRREVWLLRRHGAEPDEARRRLGRPGRLRWLQRVDGGGETVWDAFEALPGRPLLDLLPEGRRTSWETLRHWLHDLASELWAAGPDGTLPAELGLDQVWITDEGRAVLLDEPWPGDWTDLRRFPVHDLRGQQRFLDAVAGFLEPTEVPLHARPLLENLAAGRLEKLSFLAGTLRGLLEKPAAVGPAVRAGSMFLLSVYLWLMFVVSEYSEQGGGLFRRPDDGLLQVVLAVTAFVLVSLAVAQLLSLPVRTTASQAIFRLAVVDGSGRRAGIPRLAWRWAITWIPVLAPLVLLHLFGGEDVPTRALALACIGTWLAAALVAVRHPHRGLQDRLSGTWVVRR